MDLASARYEIAVPMPPVVLIGNANAGCHYSALFRQPSSQPVNDFIKEMRSLCKVAMSLREPDSASTCLKTVSFEQSQQNDRTLSACMVCGLHQVNRVTGAVLQQIGVHAIAGMYSHASLLNMGNFWVRTLLSIQDIVDDPSCVAISHTAPADENLLMRDVIMELFFPRIVQRRFGKNRAKAHSESKQAKEEDSRLRQEWRVMMNGYMLDPSQPLTHHCHLAAGCGCKSVSNTRHRIQQLLLRVMYRRRPAVPQLKEWTRCRDSSRFHCFGMLTSGLLQRVFHKAVQERPGGHQPLPGPVNLALVPWAGARAEAPQAPQPAPLQHFIDETDWHKLVGKKIKNAASIMSPSNMLVTLPCILEGVILEATESLSDWFAVAERACRSDSCGSSPPLMDLLWPEKSPTTPVLQFLAAVAHGEHPAAQLLWTCGDASSWAELQRHDPQATMTVRKGLTTASLWTFIRACYRFDQWPWRLVVTADTRRAANARDVVAKQFMQCCEGCLDPGHSQKVRRLVTASHDLFSARFQTVHWELGWLLDLQNDSSERKHARNKKTFGADTQLDLFTARSVLQDAQAAAPDFLQPL